MKNFLFAAAFIFLTQNILAQGFFTKERLTNLENFDKKFLSWGYYLGGNSYDFKFDYIEDKGYDENGQDNTDILVTSNIGFNVGLVGDMRIMENINLRLEPGLYFSKRDLDFPGFGDNKNAAHREVKSTYIHIPLLLKLSTNRLNNFRPFIVGGVSTAFNLSSEENNPDDTKNGKFRMVTNPMFYEIGFGIDFYMYYFKFTPSIRGIFAMTNELVPDNDPNSPYTSNIENLYTRGVFINFTFQ